jgi:GxxExxY protein
MEYRHSEITKEIIAAAMDVHKELGCGFQEVIYQRSLEFELTLRKINFAREFEMPVYYKSAEVGSRRVDFLVNGLVAVELKALVRLEDVHLAQALNYLEAYNLEVGLLINFGAKSLDVKRLYNKKFKPIS